MPLAQRPILVALLLTAPPLTAQTFTWDDPVSHYAVHRAATPIAIDGRLDEFAWEGAAQINRFARILNDYDLVRRATRARMLWDDENFYFAFVCQDPDLWAIYDQEDDRLWEEEVVEVFIDPDGDGRNYLELEVNPLNAVVDLKIYALSPTWHASMDWDIAGLQTAVRAYGTVNDSLGLDLGWIVEIAIPWAAMADSIDGGGRPRAGHTWRLNLYRIERSAGRALKSRINELSSRAAPLREKMAALLQESGASSGEDLKGKARREFDRLQKELEPLQSELESLQERHHRQTEYTAWSETYERGFHHPARFGVVQFVE